ncbi:hypothetical protein [Streptomyces tendae]|uniref:hypothetical protein n=1 Tax=Streptomyces tendae TaxID=1932 RepID=UPI003657CC3E
MNLQPGTQVVTTVDDPQLSEGSLGTVVTVYDDPVDGVDVAFESGQFNVLSGVLAPKDRAVEK